MDGNTPGENFPGGISQGEFGGWEFFRGEFSWNLGHQIIELWMLCAVNLFFSFKAHKNIRKLNVLFSSLFVEFGLWCEFFAGKIVLLLH